MGDRRMGERRLAERRAMVVAFEPDRRQGQDRRVNTERRSQETDRRALHRRTGTDRRHRVLH